MWINQIFQMEYVLNKSYVCVWNEAIGSWVAASENTVTRSKRGTSRRVLATAISAIVGSTALMADHEALAGEIPFYDNFVILSGVSGRANANGAPFPDTDAEGRDSGDYSAIAIGAQSLASGGAAMAIGQESTAYGNRSTALGYSS